MPVLDANLLELAKSLLAFPADEFQKHPNLSADECLLVCQTAIHRLTSSDSCLRVDAPVNIVGDLHGQFHDLLRIFDKVGQPPQSRFLFLGDYIDRGKFSLEVIVLLLSLMLMYPNSVHMLRGNHEATSICCRYGFKDEVLTRFGEEVGWRVFQGFMRCFQYLPYAAFVKGQVFCCHGGLSPSFLFDPFVNCKSQDDVIAAINAAIVRPKEPPQVGPMCDLLWADPATQSGHGTNEHHFLQDDKPSRIRWMPSKRGCSYIFSQEALDTILTNFGVQLMVRGHQLANEGFMACLNRRCITIFSASGYCGTHENNGAILQLGNDRVNLRKAGNFVVIGYQPHRPFNGLFFGNGG